MSVEFQEENTELDYNPPQQLPGASTGPLERLLIRAGIAEDATRADYFLIGVMFVFMLVTYFVFYDFVWSGGRHTPTAAERQQMVQEAKQEIEKMKL